MMGLIRRVKQERSVEYCEAAGWALLSGNLNGALDNYRAALDIRKRLVALEPANTERREMLSDCYNSIGNVLTSLNDLTQALSNYRLAHAICKDLAMQNHEAVKWQQSLACSYNQIGNIMMLQQDYKGALAHYQEGLAISERISAQKPDDCMIQDLKLENIHDVGRALEAQGDLAGALEKHRNGLAVSELAANKKPEWDGCQYELSGSINYVGRVLEAQGHFAEALEHYQRSLTILEWLAARKCAVNGFSQCVIRRRNQCYYNVGRMLKARGNCAGALEQYRKALATSEELAAQAPKNNDLKIEIITWHDRIIAIIEAQGDWVSALEQHRKGLAVCEWLAVKEPENTRYQQELRKWNNRIGRILEAQTDMAGALVHYRKGLAICEMLASTEPANNERQCALGWCYIRVGRTMEAQCNLAGAMEQYRSSLRILQKLTFQDPANINLKWYNAIVNTAIAHILCLQGEFGQATINIQQADAGLRGIIGHNNQGFVCELAIALLIHARVIDTQGDKTAGNSLRIEAALLRWDPEQMNDIIRRRYIDIMASDLLLIISCLERSERCDLLSRLKIILDSTQNHTMTALQQAIREQIGTLPDRTTEEDALIKS